jgi:nitrogen-specific signal transduction histidine kinase
LVQRELLSHRVSLRTELAPALPMVLADRVQLQQVIINLVINGIEAMQLGNFLRTLATPDSIKDWSLTSLKEKLIKIGAKVVSDGRYVAFQMAEVAIPGNFFADILRMIAELRPPPVASTA